MTGRIAADGRILARTYNLFGDVFLWVRVQISLSMYLRIVDAIYRKKAKGTD